MRGPLGKASPVSQRSASVYSRVCESVYVCRTVCSCLCEGPRGGHRDPSRHHTVGLPWLETWDVDLVSTVSPAEPICRVLWWPGKLTHRRWGPEERPLGPAARGLVSGSWACRCPCWQQREESRRRGPWCVLAFGRACTAPSRSGPPLLLAGLSRGVFLGGTSYQLPLGCF